MKKFSKIIPPLLMYVVIAVEFLFVNTTGNYIYSRYYDNIVLKTLLTLSFLIFPILSVLFLNRCFCGKSYSKNKIFNIGLMLIIFLDSDSDFVLLIILGLILFNVSFSNLTLF